MNRSPRTSVCNTVQATQT